MKRARSARGEIVDFDLISIKDQLAGAPTTIDVQARKNYIDEKEGIKRKTTAYSSTEEVESNANADDTEVQGGDPLDLVNNK